MRIKPGIVLKRPVSGLSGRALLKFLTDACRAAEVRGGVTLLVTGNREIREMNWRFKGERHATDVLSFPSSDCIPGFAGDIAISLDIAAKNARALRHSVSDEVRILVLHGILHLAGYDHEHDSGEMARREQALRKRFTLPTALIERSFKQAPNHKSTRGLRKPRVSL